VVGHRPRFHPRSGWLRSLTLFLIAVLRRCTSRSAALLDISLRARSGLAFFYSRPSVTAANIRVMFPITVFIAPIFLFELFNPSRIELLVCKLASALIFPPGRLTLPVSM